MILGNSFNINNESKTSKISLLIPKLGCQQRSEFSNFLLYINFIYLFYFQPGFTQTKGWNGKGFSSRSNLIKCLSLFLWKNGWENALLNLNQSFIEHMLMVFFFCSNQPIISSTFLSYLNTCHPHIYFSIEKEKETVKCPS